jgi:hypothetical protein
MVDEGPGAQSLGLTQLERIHADCVRFEQAWRSGGRPNIQEYLAHDASLSPQLLIELVQIDLEFRLKLREEPRVEEYQHAFPQLAADRPALALLIRREIQLRRALRAELTPQEYWSRFPDYRAEIQSAFDLHLAETVATKSAESVHGDRRQPAPISSADFQSTERFSVYRRLGAGAMGMVYEAYDRQRQAWVALKTMQQVNPTEIYRLKQEFRSLADLAHPNLISLYELVSDEGVWFFTMELIQGTDFLSFVRDGAGAAVTNAAGPKPPAADPGQACIPRPLTRPLAPPGLERLRSALTELAEGLVALHSADRLHRDIKPSNVLVTKEGRVVLLDFGLASMLEKHGLYQSIERHVVGTAAYMSPEQARSSPLTPATDLYSMGVMLYESLTGRLPFEGGWLQVLFDKQHSDPVAPRELVPSVPEDLNLLCVQLLRTDPDRRPTARDVLDRLGSQRQRGRADLPLTRISPVAACFEGRESHLARLDEAWQAARRGRSVVVTVQGNSGVGKSALITRFLSGLMERDEAVILCGRCYERESVPYKALDALLDDLTRYLKRLPRAAAESLLPRHVTALARLFPALNRVDAVLMAPGPVLAIPDRQELRRRAFAALRELLQRIAERKPMILSLDDLQWGDADSAALLAELFHSHEPLPLLLLLCHRSQETSSSSFLQAFKAFVQKHQPIDSRELTVGALTAREAKCLALSLLGPRDGRADERAEMIARESGGNPYFIGELVNYLIVEGELDGAPFSPGELRLEAVLLARLARLPADARRLLEIIAVAGRPLAREVACQAANLSDAEARAAIAVLQSTRHTRTTGGDEVEKIETYHDRIRETVVAGLDDASLKEHHRRLAVALEAFGRAHPETLAAHFRGADDFSRAGEQYAVAAANAAEALAFDHAVWLYQCALEFGPADHGRLRDLRVKLADALATAGRGAEAAEYYLAAAEGASAEEALDLQRKSAFQSLISGHIDRGIAAFRDVLRAAGMKLPRTPGTAIVSLLLQRAQLRLRGLRFRARQESEIARKDLMRIDVCWAVGVGLTNVDTIRGAYFHARNLLLSLRAGEPQRIARALAMEAVHVGYGGGPARLRAEALLAAAERLAQDVGTPQARGFLAMSRGMTEYLAGNWRPALDYFVRADKTFREECTGAMWELDRTQAFRLWSLLWLGEFPELARRLPRILRDADERGDLFAATVIGTGIQVDVQLAAGQPEQALAKSREAIKRWSQSGFHVQHFSGLIGRLHIDLYTGNGSAAWRHLADRWPAFSRSMLRRVQMLRIFSSYLRGLAALAAAQQDVEPTHLLAVAEKESRALRRERMAWSNPLADLLQAGLAAVRGDQAAAAVLYGQAATGLEQAEMAVYAAAARRRQGECVGGAEGQAMIQVCDAYMAEQGISDPRRMTATLVPARLHD